MANVWTDFCPPTWIDPEAFLYMGADPAWTPAKEEKQQGCADAAPSRCCLCGGADGEYLHDEWGNLLYDPVSKFPAVKLAPQIKPGSAGVCGRCMRYGRQRKLQAKSAGMAASAPVPAPSQPPSKGGAVAAEKSSRAAEKPVVGHGTITLPERFASCLNR